MQRSFMAAFVVVLTLMVLASVRSEAEKSHSAVLPTFVVPTVKTPEPGPVPVVVAPVRLSIPADQNTKLARQRFSRLSINEFSKPLRNGGVPTPDNLAILQTVLAFQEWQNGDRRKPMTVQDVVGIMAPRMAGLKPQRETKTQQRWTRNLPMTGLAQPEGWEPRDGTWSQFADNWASYRDNVALVFANGFEPPCKGKPIAWGNSGDDHIAISRKLCKLDCVGTVNWFWGFPKANADVPCEMITEPRVPAPLLASRGKTISAAEAGKSF